MTDLFTGNLLVASSIVDDPLYAGGVCLIVHQDETNVIGVMLNRPMKPSNEALQAMFAETEVDTGTDDKNDESEKPTNRLVDQAPGTAAQSSPTHDLGPWRALHFGGPLSGPVVALHQVSKYAEAETGNGVFVAAQKQHLEGLFRLQESPCRLIVGHLGWEHEHLQAEIETGRWHMIPANAETVFSSAQEMWPRLIRRATSNSVARWIGVPDVIGAGQLN